MDSNEKSIFATILYSNLFDYPLSQEEIWYYLISSKIITKKAFSKAFHGISQYIGTASGWYFLLQKQYLVETREKRRTISHHKLSIAKRIAYYLSFIPTVSLVAVSGSLAMENAKEDDDIDFFIITKDNTVWMTRSIVLLFLSLVGKRRKRNEKTAINKICVNMWMDEGNLFLPPSRHDIYTAHEVTQLKVLFARDKVDKAFFKENRWTKTLLPNAQPEKRDAVMMANSKKNWRIWPIFRYGEYFAKKIQVWYIKRHQTTESISTFLLAFHPYNYRDKILGEFKKNCNTYGI